MIALLLSHLYSMIKGWVELTTLGELGLMLDLSKYTTLKIFAGIVITTNVVGIAFPTRVAEMYPTAR